MVKCKRCKKEFETLEKDELCLTCHRKEEKINYMNDYRENAREYNDLIKRYNRITEKGDGVKAQKITDMPICHNATDQICTNLCEIAELEELIKDREEKLKKAIIKVEKAISTLDESLFRSLLSNKYIDGMTWEEIAVNRHCNVRNIYRLHDLAIDEIEIDVECKV
jgi:hypothetical protein